MGQRGPNALRWELEISSEENWIKPGLNLVMIMIYGGHDHDGSGSNGDGEQFIYHFLIYKTL